MTPDHDTAVAIIVAVTMIPSAMQAAVVAIESHARAAVVAVAVVTAITPYINAEPLGVSDRGRTNGDGGQSSQYVRELSHCSFSIVVTWRKRMPPGSVARNSKKLS
jgi:hypothetical protein